MRRFLPNLLLLALLAAPSLLLAQESSGTPHAAGGPLNAGLGLSGEASQNAPAQSAVPVVLGHSVVALNGPWKFQIGDNPQWADPNFDDSHWETISLAAKQSSLDPNMGFKGFVPGWTAKGHPGYAGYAWYRMQVRISGADEPLAILTPNSLDDAFQMFVNGHLIGAFGKFGQSSPAIYLTQTRRFVLPATIISPDATSLQGKTAVLAFRFYMAPRTLLQSMSGGFHAPPVIGYADAIEAAYHVAMENQFRALSMAYVSAVWFLALALLVLMLYLFDRTEAILFWPLAASVLLALVAGSYAIGGTTEWVTALSQSILDAVLGPLAVGLWLMTFWAYFHLYDRKWLRNIIALEVLWGIVSYIPFQVILLSGHASRRALVAYGINNNLRDFVLLALSVWIGWLGWRRARRGNWPLFLALLCFIGNIATNNQQLRHLVRLPGGFLLFGVHVPVFVVCSLAMGVFLSIAFLQRFRSSQRRQQAMEEDVKQAQQVQQMLVPENLPRTPGLTIESEYRPAREVGGDFFQILPHPSDGSVLVVAGDVTGKGLQAGMLVALIVGAIRSGAETNPDPLSVLNALNRRLCGRGHAHATCLALRIESDGAATLANAGHLPPYLNGKELSMDGALPLGVVENAEFSMQKFRLAHGDTLMLMSDGVAEARDAHGKLFGFSRIAVLLQRPITAAEVAAAAQSFGQEDDISVLRIVREAAPAEKAAAEPALAI